MSASWQSERDPQIVSERPQSRQNGTRGRTKRRRTWSWPEIFFSQSSPSPIRPQTSIRARPTSVSPACSPLTTASTYALTLTRSDRVVEREDSSSDRGVDEEGAEELMECRADETASVRGTGRNEQYSLGMIPIGELQGDARRASRRQQEVL